MAEEELSDYEEQIADNISGALRSCISDYSLGEDDIVRPTSCINPYGLFAHMIDPRAQVGNSFWCEMSEDYIMTVVKVEQVDENSSKYAAYRNQNLAGDIEVEVLFPQKDNGMNALEFEKWFLKQYPEGDKNE